MVSCSAWFMHYIHVALASGQFDSAGLSQHLAYVTLMLRAPCKTRSKRHPFVFSNSVANVYIVGITLCDHDIGWWSIIVRYSLSIMGRGQFEERQPRAQPRGFASDHLQFMRA